MVTLEQAKVYTTFHFVDISGTCRTFRSNGRVKVWKRKHIPQWRLPVKYGLYGYAAITDSDAEMFHIESDCPKRVPYDG